MPRKVSVCVLLYGDHPELARRCLGTLGVALSAGVRHVQDVRVGLNYVSDRTRRFQEEWAQEYWDKHRFRVISYVPDRRVGKYPLMRRMFYDEDDPLAELAMWFDDDTFFRSHPSEWWSDIMARMESCHMIGQHRWHMPVQGNQWEWVKTQPWYNSAVGMPGKLHGKFVFKFCQGAWWVIRRTVLHDLNWPIPELNHNGGDSMLGEALRHRGCVVGDYDKGLRINADGNGKHSGAKRRGMSEPVIGKHYKGKPLPTDHHDFKVTKAIYGESKFLYTDPIEAINLPCWW